MDGYAEGAADHTHTSFICLFFFGFILFRPPEGSWEEVVVAACQMPNKLDLVVKAVVRFQ